MFNFFKNKKQGNAAELERMKSITDEKAMNAAAEDAVQFLRAILYEHPAMMNLLKEMKCTAAKEYIDLLASRDSIKQMYPEVADDIHKAALRFIRKVQIRLIFHR
jgi:hypothetical protein